jgi:hypothetical protein
MLHFVCQKAKLGAELSGRRSFGAHFSDQRAHPMTKFLDQFRMCHRRLCPLDDRCYAPMA